MLSSLLVYSQKYTSSESMIKFFSEAPLENIDAVNNEARSIFDASTGDIVFSVPIESFEFEKKLMQEHFNENYLETEKYPKSTLKATIKDWSGTKGLSQVVAVGELTIHGVTNQVEINGEINYADDQVEVSAVFPVRLEDYKVKIPKAVFYNIAEEVEVTVQFTYAPYEN